LLSITKSIWWSASCFAMMMAMPGVSYAADPATISFSVSGFVVEGENPLSEKETQQILEAFKGENVDLNILQDAAKALEEGMAKQGLSFHRVVLPEQTIEDGIVKFEIIAFKIGEVTVTGNKYFLEKNIRKSLPAVKAGVLPNTRNFSLALRSANLHPAKQYDLKIKQGVEADTIDAEIKVKDNKPWTIFAGLNNIGSDETGEFRATVGGQHSNFLGADNILSMSYTTSPGHYGDVKQYGLNYQVPIYQYYSYLNFFYTTSDVDSGVVEGFDISGAGDFWGVSITRLLPNLNKYTHEIGIGFQDHLFTNEIVPIFAFFGIDLGVDVRSRPLNLDYHGEYKSENSLSNFSISAIYNLTSGSNNSDRVYEAVRFNADNDWQAIRFSGNNNYFLPRQWLLRTRVAGQWSDDILIPGEQFGLGGYYSVRGFEERAVSADSGITASLEIWAPPIKELNNLRILTFLDGGYKHLNQTLGVIEKNNDTIFSVGLGMRWQWKEQFNLSLDYGYVLDEARQLSTLADEGNAKFHLNLAYRF